MKASFFINIRQHFKLLSTAGRLSYGRETERIPPSRFLQYSHNQILIYCGLSY